MMQNSFRLAALLITGAFIAGCGTEQVGPIGQPPPSAPSSSSADGPPETAPTEPTGPAAPSTPMDQNLAVAPEGAAPPESDVTEGNYDYTVEQYLDYVVGDLDRVWSKWFIDAGYSEPYVGIEQVVPGETFRSKCVDTQKNPLVITDTFDNAVYCPSDIVVSGGVNYQGTIILPVTTFQKMWTGEIFSQQSQVVGDFGAAVIVAHEFGHHVVDELMLQNNAKTPNSVKAPTGANNELISDCFAGNWMASAYYSGLLTDTDVEEAIAALEAIGDKQVSSDPHGTPAERAAALKLGYNGSGSYPAGSPAACLATYWR